jgi:hypothetical protein
VKTDLPKLIWMKGRIESLLQGGRAKEAIALAEKANLVCRGAAFIAWDEAEEVAIAHDEVYQPSLDVPSGVSYSKDFPPSAAYMPRSGAAFMPAAKASLPERRPSFFKSKARKWWDAVLGASSDGEPVADIVDLEEPKRLTERLNRVIESVFCPDDAKKLTSILSDWAKHIDDKHVKDTLRPLLRKCDRDGDARYVERCSRSFSLHFAILGEQGRVQFFRH